MKILIVLNYYWPYISGLSECARTVAETLAKEHHVTVLAARHRKDLPSEEMLNGVKIIREDILFQISKGYVSPTFIWKFAKIQKEFDVINLHLPMAEAGLLSYLTSKNNVFVTYQCDVHLSNSLIDRCIEKAMDVSSSVCLRRAKKVVVSSIDYAYHSRILNRFSDKWQEIYNATYNLDSKKGVS